MGSTRHDQPDQPKRRARVLTDARRREMRQHFKSGAGLNRDVIVTALRQSGVFEMVAANLRRKYRIGS